MFCLWRTRAELYKVRRLLLSNSFRSSTSSIGLQTGEKDHYGLKYQYRTWTGRAAMQVLNEFHNEIFQLPPAFSQQWDPRMVCVFASSIPVVEVYPNPAGDFVLFSLNSPISFSEPGSLTVFDALGREIYTSVFTANQQQFVVEVRDWTSGVYVYHISLPSHEKIIGKFNVQH
jgi:hypothetical protein